MNLLYVHGRPLDYGRADTIQVISMCMAFSNLGINTTLLVPPLQDKSQKVENFINQEFKISASFKIIEKGIPPSNKIKKYLVSGYIREVASMVDPGVCYIRNTRLLFQAMNYGFPIVYENHNSILHLGSSLLRKYFHYRLKRVSKKRNFLKLVTINQKLAKHWEKEGIPTQKIFFYHDGFISSNYKNYVNRWDARDQVNLPKDKKIVVYTGSLNHETDKVLLNIVRSFKDRDIVFYIVGGPYDKAENLKKIAKNDGLSNVVVTGQVPHHVVPSYQYSADVLLGVWSEKVPHLDSISPLKLFEYMASGRVIVTQAYPTLKEVLIDGYNSLLADPDSFDDLLQKIDEALDMNYPNSISENARKDAFEKYTWEQRAKGIINSLKIDGTNWC